MTAIELLKTLSEAFNSDNSIGLDCACLVMSGIQNANDTFGQVETEEHAKLAIRTIEQALEFQSSEVISQFKSFGLTF